MMCEWDWSAPPSGQAGPAPLAGEQAPSPLLGERAPSHLPGPRVYAPLTEVQGQKAQQLGWLLVPYARQMRLC